MHNLEYKTKDKRAPELWGAARWSPRAQKALKWAVILMGLAMVFGFSAIMGAIIFYL